jgi:hypothetical protein
MENETTSNIIEQKESIKLIRNSRGYNWEIKVLDNDIDKLILLNNRMVEMYGNDNNKDD